MKDRGLTSLSCETHSSKTKPSYQGAQHSHIKSTRIFNSLDFLQLADLDRLQNKLVHLIALKLVLVGQRRLEEHLACN